MDSYRTRQWAFGSNNLCCTTVGVGLLPLSFGRLGCADGDEEEYVVYNDSNYIDDVDYDDDDHDSDDDNQSQNLLFAKYAIHAWHAA